MENPVPQGLIYDLPIAVIFMSLVALLAAATDIGYRVTRRLGRTFDESSKGQFTLVQGAMFGLLALLLAFTFAMAAGRFETRKSLVLEEANAIGTAYLRTEFLAPADRPQAVASLREYVALRLEFFDAGRDRDRLAAAIAGSERVHGELWALASRAQRADPLNVGIGLFAEALNAVIDLNEKRLTALANQVPESILLLLLIVALTTMLGVGYGAALHGRHVRFPTYMSVALVSAVIAITLDLDRPRRGFIEVSQSSLLRLEREITETEGPPASVR